MSWGRTIGARHFRGDITFGHLPKIGWLLAPDVAKMPVYTPKDVLSVSCHAVAARVEVGTVCGDRRRRR
jgi:hypothetical protein